MTVKVIGAGLAGCDAAWTLAQSGISVELYEMKPQKYSNAHGYAGFAELVCSNSLKSTKTASAAGLLKSEMRALGSLILECADATAVSAGGALAVDREKFSDMVTQRITSHPLITVVPGEVTEIPDGNVIIATGPLTSSAFADEIGKLCGEKYLSFYDASAPIITKDSIDFDKTFFASRYGKGDADYINCPFDEAEYDAFYEALVNAETAPLHDFEREYFKVYEGCMPIEVMAKRGKDTIRYGPMRPVGIINPHTDRRPYANLQLRKENEDGSLYNIVGFQTNLRFPEQKRVFSMIPGLEKAEFVRYGVMHRNTFINSPKLLDGTFSFRQDRRISFAGQITGVEGYMESTASGLMAAKAMVARLNGKEIAPPPIDTMLGALCNYISDKNIVDFQPMGCSMGLLPPFPEKIKGKEARYTALAERALTAMDKYCKDINI